MATKRHKPEEVVTKLRQVEVLAGQPSSHTRDTPLPICYRLPEVYRSEANRIAVENGGYSFRGYGEIVRKHLLRAKETVQHPHV